MPKLTGARVLRGHAHYGYNPAVPNANEGGERKIRAAVPHKLDAIIFEYGLSQDKSVELVVEPAEKLPALLESRAVDTALVPSVMYYQGDYLIVPDAALSTFYQVGTELLVSSKPVGEIVSIALPMQPDTGRTIIEIALRELFPETPYKFQIGAGNPYTDLEHCDAAIVSGEGAFGLPDNLKKYDIGEFWVRLTELPAVFYVWLVHSDMPDLMKNEISARVLKAKQTGLAHSDKVVRLAQERVTLNRYRLIEHLTVDLDYDLFSRQVKSLKLLGEYMADYKLIPAARKKDLEFAAHRSHVSLFDEYFGIPAEEAYDASFLFEDE